MDGASAFNNPVRSLRSNSPNAKEMADLLRERGTHPKVSFRDHFQTDILLFIRQFFPEPGACRDWWPRCLRHGWNQGTLDLFARAITKQGFRQINLLLKVKSLQQLAECIQAMFQNNSFIKVLQTRLVRVRFDELLALQAIIEASQRQVRTR